MGFGTTGREPELLTAMRHGPSQLGTQALRRAGAVCRLCAALPGAGFEGGVRAPGHAVHWRNVHAGRPAEGWGPVRQHCIGRQSSTRELWFSWTGSHRGFRCSFKMSSQTIHILASCSQLPTSCTCDRIAKVMISCDHLGWQDQPDMPGPEIGHCGIAKCWQIYTLQCHLRKRQSTGREFSVLHH